MKIIKLFPLWIILISQTATAEFNHFWVEAGEGINGERILLKTTFDDSAWALGFYSFKPADGFYGFSPVDRETGESLDPRFNVIGLSRMLSARFGWGYADVGIGLGIGKGEWLDDCKDDDHDGFFYSDDLCDLKEGTRIGIPFHASAVLGKFVGVGVGLGAFIQEDHSHVQFGITLPLGYFTR